jgi:hypothetical protein
MARIALILAFCVLASLQVTQRAYAQGLIDSKGTDFWVAFPPNDHSGSSFESYLSIFVTSDKLASVTVAATRLNGVSDTIRFVVQPNTVVSTRLEYELYELVGKSYPNGANNDSQRPSPASVNITSDEEISVYALSREIQTSDAWMVMPVDALGTDYRVLSYSSDVRDDFFTNRAYFPSQFVIIATEDDTEVSFWLSTGRSAVANNRTFNVTLQRGQSYLVQAFMNSTNQNDDLTGSRVRTNKPVVVIGSHKRAQVPILANGASRDILLEQLPAVDTWGKNYIAIPLVATSDAVSSGQADVTICRILAHQDSTMVSVNGAPGWRLNAGIRWDMPLTRPLVISANHPVLVAIIHRSTIRSGVSTRSGDPSLIIIPPLEQFLSSYRVINIEPRNPGNEFYTAHFLTITAPMLASGTIRVDGVVQPPLTLVTGSDHGYLHVPVANGTHFVDADYPFGIVIYGFGPAESYGYTGGMAFGKLFAPMVRLRALNVEGYPGARDTMYVVVDTLSETASFDALSARKLSGTIRFNQTMFVTDNPMASAYTQYTNHSFSFNFDTLRIGDTVASLPGIMVLGMKDSDIIEPYAIVWSQADGSQVSINTETVSGTMNTLGICDVNGKRLFTPLTTAAVNVQGYSLTGLLLFDVPFSQYQEALNSLPSGVYLVKRGNVVQRTMITR